MITRVLLFLSAVLIIYPSGPYPVPHPEVEPLIPMQEYKPRERTFLFQLNKQQKESKIYFDRENSSLAYHLALLTTGFSHDAIEDLVKNVVRQHALSADNVIPLRSFIRAINLMKKNDELAAQMNAQEHLLSPKKMSSESPKSKTMQEKGLETHYRLFRVQKMRTAAQVGAYVGASIGGAIGAITGASIADQGNTFSGFVKGLEVGVLCGAPLGGSIGAYYSSKT